MGAALLSGAVIGHALSASGEPGPPLIRVSAGTRAVVLSPHPDDAVLGAGGLIQRIEARGGSVEIVEVTSGDAFAKGIKAMWPAVPPSPTQYRWYGSVRERETVEAMRGLGVGRSRLRLLGFPDDGLCELARDRTSAPVFASPYTGRDSPPSAERLVPGAKYRGDDVRGELAQIFLAFRPTLVVVPDPRDEHPDHCSTHLLAHAALEAAYARGLHPVEILHYVIHYHQWPDGSAPQPFASDSWRALRLTRGEREGKARAIEAFHSQLTVMAPFLRAFDRTEEVFTLGDPSPMAPCWCRGENILHAADAPETAPQEKMKRP